MERLRRWTTRSIAVWCVVGLLAGCGGGDDGQDTTPGATNPGTTNPGTTGMVIREAEENMQGSFAGQPACMLRVRLRNPTGQLASVALVYNAFDVARMGIATTLITALVPPTSTQTAEQFWVIPGGTGSFLSSCSRIASFMVDPSSVKGTQKAEEDL